MSQFFASGGQKYWSFSFRISPSSEYSGMISFRIDWLDLLAVRGTYVYSTFIHNCQNLETIMISFSRWKDKCAVLCLAAQSCLTLWPCRRSLPGSSVHGDSLGKNTGVGWHALLQGTLPTQGLNPGLPHCRQIIYQLSHQGSPRILEWVAYPFSRACLQPRNWVLLHCRWIHYQLSY